MKQVDRLLVRVEAPGRKQPIVRVFDNLTDEQLHEEATALQKQNPRKEVIVINIVPADDPPTRTCVT